ncbi:hypothetical protein HPB50_013592 [Hyalomma asiaticum]|uniref:Uncharacterized protein n=1 Tax=Hyalomma asiaticum TaxID=266040 RepID=A0ACB7RNH2_HYAAI|nr:hypothetical protein HPB50_013592 [Hyalomma asiaticum]
MLSEQPTAQQVGILLLPMTSPEMQNACVHVQPKRALVFQCPVIASFSGESESCGADMGDYRSRALPGQIGELRTSKRHGDAWSAGREF